MILRAVILIAVIMVMVNSLNELKKLDISDMLAGGNNIYHSNNFTVNSVSAIENSIEALLDQQPMISIIDGQPKAVPDEWLRLALDYVSGRSDETIDNRAWQEIFDTARKK